MDKIHSFMKKQFVQKSGVRSGNLTIGQKSYKTRKILQSGIPVYYLIFLKNGKYLSNFHNHMEVTFKIFIV